ncbi:hypothetical protein WN71_015205 [Streptomyces mangrovisoli]|uniref:Peptidase S53 domain-containing protein n=2 Tax=Streptomyces mangrovisoli TaxID=1428628 RepID=A0A1J4P0V6_9ACTN|nr:hypothetical protein WN71_015205 [Streptomyces mangrovisoli]
MLAAAALGATGVVGAPAAQAADHDKSVIKLTPSALKKLSARYKTRADGTPGQVASVGGDGTASDTGSDSGSTSTGSGSGTDDSGSTGGSAFGLKQDGQWETARGVASTTTLGGTGDWLGIYSSGTVTRTDAKGDPVWTRTSHSLMTDWGVKPTSSLQAEEYVPELYEGYNPYQPSSTGKSPYATGDFNHDGVADLAVAYNVGSNPVREFTSPGSDLQTGTFLTVLDGRTGSTLYSKLLPGYVGSMLVQDGKLVVADRTGPDWSNNPVAEQGDSRSNLTAYSFTSGGKGKLTGHVSWTYSTGAPWAYWGDLTTLSGGRIAASWTDTPMGLGNPRPAAGHVLVLSGSSGKATVDTKTAGYPRMLAADPDSDRVLVVEQNDPYDAVRWDLTGVDAHSGKRTVLASREGTIPEDFEVNTDAHGGQAAYAVAELGINADLSDGQSTISGWDSHGKTLWTRTTASTVGGANAPTTDLKWENDGADVVAAISDPVEWSSDRPDGPEHTQLTALDGRRGGVDWAQDGAVVGDRITDYRGALLTFGYDDTAYVTDPRKGTATTTLPQLGDAYTAVAADVNGDGVKDLVVGGQSRGVFALDGRTLDDAVPRQLWHATVGGPVRQLQTATLTDAKGRRTASLVAATTSGFAVLTTATGAVRADKDLGGGFVPTVTVTGDGHGGSEVVAAGSHSVAAYDGAGKALWTYTPSGTTGKTLVFSNVAADADGNLYLEYGGHRSAYGTGVSDPAPTELSLSATGKARWSALPNDAKDADWVVQDQGVYVSSAIPGANGRGVAFSFGGDKPAGLGITHLTQILDTADGSVVLTHHTTGVNTHIGFVASKADGLIELRYNGVTVFPADGGDPYNVSLGVMPFSAVVDGDGSGTDHLIAAINGIYGYGLPLDPDDSYPDPAAEDFGLFAGTLVAAHVTSSSADDLIATTQDQRAFAISLQTGGFDYYSSDYYQHGITVYSVTGGSGASTTSAVPSSTADTKDDAAFGTTADIQAAAPLKDPGLPKGTASLPLQIKSSTKVTDPDTVTASGTTDVNETTKGYTPQQIQARLGLTGDGTGQTVAIVDAYDYPNAASDLNHFAAHFGLPQTCDSVEKGTDCFDFSQVHAAGTTPDANSSWEEEEALDIEWVHAVAPHAKIVLVEAADASAEALYQAVDVAAALHPAAVSNSWGMSEFSEESYYDSHCKLADSVCTQSTGDDGYPAGYSSTNPYALAVGGTKLTLDASGATQSETAWASTGGGLSYFEKRPAYQDGVQSSAYRATPDVSFVADPTTGVAVYTTATSNAGIWLQVGGTSLSAPSWAGILAATDQLRSAAGKAPLASAGTAGDTAHKDVYALGDHLYDVTSGSNGACGTECTAGTGYDTVTGLGSPLAGVDKALSEMK